MEIKRISSSNFPPGFRFHPSDEELIVHYLLKKLGSRPLPAQVVAEIDLYSYNPWELPKKASFGEDEWYFFTPRDRKYPNGIRPNRTASSGFWKATGTDKPILTASGSRRIGVKKSLVFYTGRPPKGSKTDWIMNEYRLPDTMARPSRSTGSMRLDDWVLCRVRQKGNTSKKNWEVEDGPNKLVSFMPNITELPSDNIAANAGITTDYLLKDCQILASMVAPQQISPIKTASNATFPCRNNDNNRDSDNTSGNGHNFTTTSFFQTFLNPTISTFNNGNMSDNSVDTEMLELEGYRNEFLPSGNMLNTNAMNFYYNQNQAQGNVFSPIHSNAILNLLLSQADF